MGITGLLGFVSAASRPTSIREFSGETAAIDAYCWLHKGAFGCADRLVTNTHTDLYIKYCMKYVYMLLFHNVKPILVFDGRHLPAKLLTEKKRKELRVTAKKRAAEMLRMGKTDEAKKHMQRCVDITHEMALELIKECRRINVDCIVAPYEADAQLAYLNKIDIAQIVITEDSDLLLFGCSKILFKMDLNGNGTVVENEKLPLVMKCPLERYTFDKFRQMCILSGCDYLASLPGIGLANARKFINATQDPDICNALKKMPSFLNKRNIQVTDEYRDAFAKAEATFKHQFVYDPLCRSMIPLNPLEDEGTDPKHCSNAGVLLDDDVAFQLAIGNLDPFTLRKMDDWNPDKRSEHTTNKQTKSHKSIWDPNYKKHSSNIQIKDDKSAIIKPITRIRKSVTLSTTENIDAGLTLDDLRSMYCQEPIAKKLKSIIIPETQDFDDIDFVDCRKTKSEITLSTDDQSHSNNSSNEESTSPIIKIQNRDYRKLRKSISSTQLEKLSRFRRTIIDDNVTVQSKFFNNSVVENSSETSVDSANSHLSKDTDCERDVSLKPTDEFSTEAENNENEMNLKTFELSHSINHDSNKNRNPFKIISESQIVCESNNENREMGQSSDIIPESQMSLYKEIKEDVNNKIVKPSVKRKYSCRASGLKKTRSISNAQTLLTVFGFEKKCKLEH